MNRQADTSKTSSGNRRRLAVFLALATATLQVAAALGLMILMGTPRGAVADDLALVHPSSNDVIIEIPLLAERLQNNRTGITRVYDVEIVLKATSAEASRIREEIIQHGHEYRAAVTHLWRSADPAHLDEPSLKTLSRRLRGEMLEFFGREAVSGKPVIRDVIVISGTGFPAE
ncbi:MAG: hypothetical protein VX527_02740 [Planctomycetota bacterium]|nr:hypothetical protein [Planctomycetota bacterium]